MPLNIDHSRKTGLLLSAVLDPSLCEARYPAHHFLETLDHGRFRFPQEGRPLSSGPCIDRLNIGPCGAPDTFRTDGPSLPKKPTSKQQVQ
ncbi:MAG: hypothetical protein CME78_04655 [Halomonas sp.]|nr:hypothetical protein [Halomonas sp.]